MSNLNFFLSKNCDIKKIFYTKNKKSFFAFCVEENDNKFIDVITNKIIDKKHVFTVHYNYNNLPVIKYYNQLYCKKHNLTVFRITPEVENEILLETCFRILKFFNLSYEELYSANPKQSTLKKVLKKRFRYLSRYIDKKTLTFFETQTKQLKTINQVLCFLPIEIYNKKQPFWCLDLKDHTYFNQALFNNINAETVEAIELLDLTMLEVICNLEKTKNSLLQHKETLKNIKNVKLRIKLAEIIQLRIAEAKQTLKEEYEEASQLQDEEIQQEIQFIEDSLKQLESVIYKQIETVTLETNLEEWWPDLLLPLPPNQVLRSLSELPMTKEHRLNLLLLKNLSHDTVIRWIDFLQNKVLVKNDN